MATPQEMVTPALLSSGSSRTRSSNERADAQADRGGLGVVGAGEHADELVAPVARRRVLAAQGVVEHLGEDGEHAVPGGVPVGVVHRLEPVEVAEDHAEGGGAAACARHLLVERAGQLAVVGEAR